MESLHFYFIWRKLTEADDTEVESANIETESNNDEGDAISREEESNTTTDTFTTYEELERHYAHLLSELGEFDD